MTPSDNGSTLVASLKRRHYELVARSVENAVSAEERRQLVDDLVAAGVSVPPGSERDGLRNLLYYWAGDQLSRGERAPGAPAPALAPFDAGTGGVANAASEAAAQPATSGVSAAPGPAVQRAAAVAAAVATTQSSPDSPPGDTTVSTAAAPPDIRTVEPAAPADPTAAPSTSAARGAAGFGRSMAAVRRLLGLEPAQALVGVSAPAKIDVSALTDAEARRAVRIAALAREWRSTDKAKKKGYLITDANTLAEAMRFADVDPDIQALVEASKRELEARATTKRRLKLAAGVFVVVAGTAFLLTHLYYYHRTKQELRELRGKEAERTDQRKLALDAVQALRRNDIGPLRTLMNTLVVGNDPKDVPESVKENLNKNLDLLQIRPLSLGEQELEGTPAAPKDDSAAIRQATAAGVEPCEGYLWFGGTGSSRVESRPDPSTLKAGETVKLDQHDDIRLRADWPSDDYVMSRQIGLVPAGSEVKLVTDVKRYPRGAAPDQFWAKVSVPRVFCTNVFLQYVGPSAKRKDVLKVLDDMGLQTPPAEEIARAKGLAEVRYFATKDQPVADQVAKALARFNGGSKLNLVDLTEFPRKPPAYTMEVWLDLSRTP